jgi:hypothetical protein
MKVNLTIRFQMTNLELPDHLDPGMYSKNSWRTRWGHFSATEGPIARPRHPYDRERELFVEAARAELAGLLAKHGVDALGGTVEIIQEDVPEC